MIRKLLWLLLVLFLYSLVVFGIWLLVPQLPLDLGTEPEEVRRLVTMVFALILGGAIFLGMLALWIKRLLASDSLRRALIDLGEKEAESQPPDVAEQYAELHAQFERAIKEVGGEKGRWWSWGNTQLYGLPWFVIIGPPNAGKSTSLRRSGIRFPHSQAVQGVGGTRHCDWWFGEEAIFLDTAGRYSLAYEDQPEWEAFLGLLRKHRRRRPIDGALVMVGLDEIIGADERQLEELAERLRDRLHDLNKHLKVQVPSLLVLTKADLVQGLRPYYSALDENQKDLPLGFSLPSGPLSARATWEVIKERLKTLLAETKEKRPVRLLRAQSRLELEAVQAMPHRLADLAPVLARLIGLLAEPSTHRGNPDLRGVYLISSTQESQELQIESARDVVAERFGLPSQHQRVTVDPAIPDRSLFLKGLFQKVLLNNIARPHIHTQDLVRQRRNLIASGLVGCLLCTLSTCGLTYQFDRLHDNVLMAQVLTGQLGHTEEHAPSASVLGLLGELQSVLSFVDEVIVPQPGRFSEMASNLDRFYAYGLREHMEDPIASFLSEQVIKSASFVYDQSPEADEAYQSYLEALRAYLALGDECDEGDELLPLLEKVLRAEDSPISMGLDVSSPLLADLVGRLGTPPLEYINLDTNAVDRARSHLLRLTTAERLIYQECLGIAVSAGQTGPMSRPRIRGTIPLVPASYLPSTCEHFLEACSELLEAREATTQSCVFAVDYDPSSVELADLNHRYQDELHQAWREWISHWEVQYSAPSYAVAVDTLRRISDRNTSDIILLFKAYGGMKCELPEDGQSSKSVPIQVDPRYKRLKRISDYGADQIGDLTGKDNGPSCGKILEKVDGPCMMLLDPMAPGHSELNDLLTALSELQASIDQLSSMEPNGGPSTNEFVQYTMVGQGHLAAANRALSDLVNLSDSETSAARIAVGEALRPLLMDIWFLVRKSVQRDLERQWKSVYRDWQNLSADFPFNHQGQRAVGCQRINAFMGGPDAAIQGFVSQQLLPYVEASSNGQISRRGSTGMSIPLSNTFITSYNRLISLMDGRTCDDAPPVHQLPTRLSTGSQIPNITEVRLDMDDRSACYSMSSKSMISPARCSDPGLGGSGLQITLYRRSGGTDHPRGVGRPFRGPWSFQRFLQSASQRHGDTYLWNYQGEHSVGFLIPPLEDGHRISIASFQSMSLPPSLF